MDRLSKIGLSMLVAILAPATIYEICTKAPRRFPDTTPSIADETTDVRSYGLDIARAAEVKAPKNKFTFEVRVRHTNLEGDILGQDRGDYDRSYYVWVIDCERSAPGEDDNKRRLTVLAETLEEAQEKVSKHPNVETVYKGYPTPPKRVVEGSGSGFEFGHYE